MVENRTADRTAQMPHLTLENIVGACGGTFVGDRARLQDSITGVQTDSRKIEPGSLFVPIVGAKVDGHSFIPDVFAKGACATLAQTEPADGAGPYILVDSTEKAMQKLAAFYRKRLGICVVGITGSVGKTSTKEMIASVLGQRYRVLKTPGNFNNGIGLPLTIFQIRQEHQVAVLEMGISDFGEMHLLSEIAKPNIGVITNIGLCHLENLGTRDGILQAKTEMFDHMQPEGTVILNGDDDRLCTRRTVNGKPVIFYGLENSRAEIYAADIENLGLEGVRAQIHTPEGSFFAHIPIPGEHNVYNALAATAVGLALSLSTEEIARGIAAVQTIAGRSNRIETKGMTVIDDCYNANPMSMRASLEVLARAKGRRIAVLGDMGELGSGERMLHRGVGETAAEYGIDALFAAGELAKEYAVAAAEGDCDVHYYRTVQQMLPELLAYVREGDVILVKASHFMDFPQVVRALAEQQEVVDSIYNRKRGSYNGKSESDIYDGRRGCDYGGALSGDGAEHREQFYQSCEEGLL